MPLPFHVFRPQVRNTKQEASCARQRIRKYSFHSYWIEIITLCWLLHCRAISQRCCTNKPFFSLVEVGLVGLGVQIDNSGGTNRIRLKRAHMLDQRMGGGWGWIRRSRIYSPRLLTLRLLSSASSFPSIRICDELCLSGEQMRERQIPSPSSSLLKIRNSQILNINRKRFGHESLFSVPRWKYPSQVNLLIPDSLPTACRRKSGVGVLGVISNLPSSTFLLHLSWLSPLPSSFFKHCLPFSSICVISRNTWLDFRWGLFQSRRSCTSPSSTLYTTNAACIPNSNVYALRTLPNEFVVPSQFFSSSQLLRLIPDNLISISFIIQDSILYSILEFRPQLLAF